LEIFKDYTIDPRDSLHKDFHMISKRPYNTEFSAFKNMRLDLNDFHDRVKPQSADILQMDMARRNQRNGLTRQAHLQKVANEKREQFISEGGSAERYDAQIKENQQAEKDEKERLFNLREARHNRDLKLVHGVDATQ